MPMGAARHALYNMNVVENKNTHLVSISLFLHPPHFPCATILPCAQPIELVIP